MLGLLLGSCQKSSESETIRFNWQVSKARVKQTVDAEFLAELGYVASAQVQRSKEIKSNTKMHYTQVK